MANTTLQSFNVFLTQRLTAAAVEIFGFVEKTIIDYHEEVYRAKQENQRLQRLLDLVYKPEIRLYRADSKPPTFPASTEELFPKQQPVEQEWNPGLGQEEPGPSQIKVEEEEEKVELWASQNEEPPSAEESDDGDALTRELIKTVQELENHTTTENSSALTEENSEPQPSSAEDPNGSDAKKGNDTFYRCHICNFIFTKEVVLTWHLKTHTDKGTFDCQICGKHIPCQSTLQTHMRVHTGERPYSCHFCGKSFKLKGHMKEHIRTHTGEKPFICHICGKSFNRGSTMRKHVFVKHKEERPYKCADCDELFTERLLMKRHMRKVHGIKLS